ncbi:hypothetical protein RRX38_02045 [Pseudomonas sp. DTU_2021_1001937_2_SI_NGA_ILE_001]|uniref:hypothetical protein n=1 Tax=Pseudomonas sp. DTU_2021_1001937_2_SI_NGA_ILE_001 TaxID=3077589 RepID=UPI0028FC1B50|nr:hypothetical protein [Pseudomonas sp. DTU_2021_1001937_2_SI_NGA_ILE_001]WNW09978.1 hypothetical protein RRX38_02045 [Pseudomonas sp. DTU_2021_1001937_2_SI_NGA_ILE_001]
MPALFRLMALAPLAVTLHGCSINGTYPESTNPEAAKLRYISGNSSATLDLFDGDHCAGWTTGLLNNLFVADTRKRVDMIVPPPAGTKSYYELRMEPGKPVYFRVNTQNNATQCSVAFNLTPQPGSEYELSFKERPGLCVAQFVRLQKVGGEYRRQHYPMVNEAPDACLGKNPLFPKPPTALPDTAERAELIEQIMRDSFPPRLKMLSRVKFIAVQDQEPVETQIAKRKHEVGFELPDSYWEKYRANLRAYAEALSQIEKRVDARFEADSLTLLRSVSTEQLSVWAGKTHDRNLKSREKRLKDAEFYHGYVAQQTFAQIQLEHLQKMAQLDQTAGVCEHYAGCWRL